MSNATLSDDNRTRINGYLHRDKRGAHVTLPDEDATHRVLDKRVGWVDITWDSHEARCRVLGIQFGSDGPYFGQPGERRRALTPGEVAS